jgi:hypothetical protein
VAVAGSATPTYAHLVVDLERQHTAQYVARQPADPNPIPRLVLFPRLQQISDTWRHLRQHLRP